MTQAVCFNCGAMKFGALLACKQCKKTPSTDDDFVLSLAMTDRIFSADVMHQMGRSIERGESPQLDDETHKGLLDQLAQLKTMLRCASQTDEPVTLSKKFGWGLLF